jgi:hypothetical protein
MYNSNLHALDKAFWNATFDKAIIPFDPKWNNGTGYLDGIVSDESIKTKPNGLYATHTGICDTADGLEPINDRKVIIAVKDGKVYVAFERSTKGNCGRVAYNSPHRETYDQSEGMVNWLIKYASGEQVSKLGLLAKKMISENPSLGNISIADLDKPMFHKVQ